MSTEDAFYGPDNLFTLKDASDVACMRAVLEPELPAVVGPGARLVDLEIELLRRRKQRCVLRYRLDIEQEGARRDLSLIAKVYRAGAGDDVAGLMRQLSDHGFDRDAADGISIPDVVSYLPRLSLLVQEEIGGRPVKDFLPTPDAEWALRRMAVALAKLHRTPLRPTAPYTIEDHLRRCHPHPQVLRDRCPDLRPAIDEILDEAARLEAAYRVYEPALIHGDCHMGQVHVAPERTWIIDFDACCVADPAADIGNLLVFLKGKARRIPSAPLLVEAFLDEYFEHMPAEILVRVPLFEAITHLRRACKRLRFGEEGWERKARKFIDDSLTSLAAARG